MLNKKILTTCLLTILTALSIGIALANPDDLYKTNLNRLLAGDKNLAGVRLKGANLKGKDLSNTNFTKANLEEANLSSADLTNANFQDADLEETNLKGAKIQGANFKNAELEYATWVDGRICAEGSIGGCW